MSESKKQYFAAGRVAVCVNYKAASATLSRAIIAAHHPDVESMITTPPGTGNGTAYPAGRSADNTRWHALCPRIDRDAVTSTVLVVRHPADRFVSACAETGTIDVDALLDRLETDSETNPHFWPQSRFAGDSPKLYRFDRDLDQLASDLGLTWPLPRIIRRDNPPKPTLTDSQTERVRHIFSEDLMLYQSFE